MSGFPIPAPLYLKGFQINYNTYHPKGYPHRTFANDPVFVFCHIRGCRLRSPFFCSSLECTVLLTSSCSTRARWIKEVLVRQCFAFALCYAPKLDWQCLADLQTSLRWPHTRPIHGLFRPSWAKWCSLGKALKARAPFGLRATKATSSTDYCLVLLQFPKCFGLVQIFCARPKIYLHIVAVTNILCQTKR